APVVVPTVSVPATRTFPPIPRKPGYHRRPPYHPRPPRWTWDASEVEEPAGCADVLYKGGECPVPPGDSKPFPTSVPQAEEDESTAPVTGGPTTVPPALPSPSAGPTLKPGE
ncbi:hypothetical protein ACFQ08_34335, partial [Streptosporangium algeriense]